MASIDPTPSIIHKLPDILDTGARPKFICKDQLALLLKWQVTLVTTATRIHDANEKSLQIVCCLKLNVHVGQLTELLILMVR